MATREPIEQGDPAADSRAFRRCLGQFATGVTVMTAQHGTERAGMAVNSFAALSLDPPLVLWSIRRASASLPVFTQADHFTVNVLAGDQVEVANLFATPGIDKFAASQWAPGNTGSPVLAGTIATMECAREQLVDAGDHLLVIGRVLHFERHAGEPLLFAQGRYALSQEHPAALQAAAAQRPSAATDAECSLLRLLYFTGHEMSARFDEQRREAGLTVGQFRIYGWLRSQPRTLQQLKRVTYLGDIGTEDSLAELMERGHVTRAASGTYSLTAAGREAAAASRERVRRFEEQVVRGIDPADLEATRRVLTALADSSDLA
jgi:flavin reductase (DIM6/NTAB) family NADH-FMN oxidoreductase RutF/DNA-binding MarR family transcriptional regulator